MTRVLQVAMTTEGASGVATFARRLDVALRAEGVDSRVLIEGDALPGHLDVDVVHIHGLWRPFFHAVAVRARRQRIPVVWSTHGMTAPWSMRHKWLKKFPAWWVYQRRDLRRAELVHATSGCEAKWNRRLGLDRTCIVPLGTDLPDAVPEAGLPSAGQVGRVRTLLFVGRIYSVKAIDRLIVAFSQVPADVRKGWRLRIVGPAEDNVYASALQDLVVRSGLETSCLLAGAKFGEELEREYVQCEALALVSHTENFGATVIDALAYGKPVITGMNTPWACVTETGCGWQTDNEPSVLSGTLEKMMRLTDAERAEMGRRGRALVEAQYTWPAVAKRMNEAYETLIRIAVRRDGHVNAAETA